MRTFKRGASQFATRASQTLIFACGRSRQLFDALNALRKNPDVAPYVLDVRGAGLMVATEFASPAPPAEDVFVNPEAPKSLASRVSARCLEKGMLLLTTSVFETVRFIPPLNISEQDLAKVRGLPVAVTGVVETSYRAARSSPKRWWRSYRKVDLLYSMTMGATF